MDLAQWKEQIKAEGKFLVGQDEFPPGKLHLIILISQNKNLDMGVLAEGMKRAGVYAAPIPKDDGKPNVYTFVGQAKSLEIAHETGTTMTTITVDTLEDVLAVDAAFVSKWDLPDTFAPEQVEELRKAMAEVDRQRAQKKALFVGNTEVGPNRWVFLRVTARPGVPPMRTEDVRNTLIEAGYKAFSPDTGLLGFLVSSEDWSAGNWTEVLFNPGNQIIKVSDLYELFDKRLVVGESPVGLYDVPFLREHQELIDLYFRAQQIETKTIGGAGAIGEGVADLINELGKASKYLKYAFWGALGIGVVLVGAKAYSLVKGA